MNANYVQRLRLTFRKEGATRYIGHLDSGPDTLERSLNRAQNSNRLYARISTNDHAWQLAAATARLVILANVKWQIFTLSEKMEPEAAKANK